MADKKINYLHDTCCVCGKSFNGNEPLTHIPFKDCDKKAIAEHKKELKKLIEEYNKGQEK